MSLTDSELRAFEEFEKSGWENAADPYHEHWGLLSSQSAGPMLDAAEVSAGSRVLDVATGAGYVAAAAAHRNATAIGVDFSSAQVELARRTYPSIEFRQANAEALPFDAGSFDAVVIGFGLNHLPVPEAAFQEAHRVLRNGGWFAFTVWAEPRAGEGFGIVMSALERYSQPNSKIPPAPPYFRFADSEEVRRQFERSGFVGATTRIVPQYWRHRSPDLVFDAFHDGAVRATAMLRSQPEHIRESIRSAVREDVRKLGAQDTFVVPVPAALSAGRKP